MLPPTLAAPARARAGVSAWLAEHSPDTAFVEVMLLLVSELVTNSIRHALIGADDLIRLTAHARPSRVRLAVWDAGTEGAVHARERHEDFGGYGLELIRRLSDSWGVERDENGTTVWLELSTPM